MRTILCIVVAALCAMNNAMSSEHKLVSHQDALQNIDQKRSISLRRLQQNFENRPSLAELSQMKEGLPCDCSTNPQYIIPHTSETLKQVSWYRWCLHYGRRYIPPTSRWHERCITHSSQWQLVNVYGCLRFVAVSLAIKALCGPIGYAAITTAQMGWDMIIPYIEYWPHDNALSKAAFNNLDIFASHRDSDNTDEYAQKIQLVQEGPIIFSPHTYQELQEYMANSQVPGLRTRI